MVSGLKGILPVLPTPFAANGDVDETASKLELSRLAHIRGLTDALGL